MAEGRRHVSATDVAHEPSGQDYGVASQREHDPEGCYPETCAPERGRKPGGNATVALTTYRNVRQTTDPALLEKECEQRKPEQDHRQHGRATSIVLRPGDRKEDLGGQHVEIAGEHDWVA